jgi:hypothetical protein
MNLDSDATASAVISTFQLNYADATAANRSTAFSSPGSSREINSSSSTQFQRFQPPDAGIATDQGGKVSAAAAITVNTLVVTAAGQRW